MRERALRPLVQVVVVQDAVLDDPDRGAGRTRRDQHVYDGPRPFAARQLVDGGHDQEQHELLVVDDADREVEREHRRDERPSGIGGQRQEEARRGRPLVPANEDCRPAEERARQHDLGGGNGHLHRRDEHQQQAECHTIEAHVLAVRHGHARAGQRRGRGLLHDGILYSFPIRRQATS
jgi:hypothetical protein